MKGIKLAIASLIAGATLVTLQVTAAEKPVDLNALLNQVKASSLSESQLNKEREARFLADKNEQTALLAKAKADLAAVLVQAGLVGLYGAAEALLDLVGLQDLAVLLGDGDIGPVHQVGQSRHAVLALDLLERQIQ